LKFPTLNEKSNKKFASYLKVLRLLYNQLNGNSGGYISKRQIYYQDVTLFNDQKTVDAIIDNLIESFGCHLEDVGVVASQKGFIFGDLTMRYRGEEWIFRESKGADLIPVISMNSSSDDFVFETGDIEEILVIEKESVFKKICENERGNRKLILTGKGFADRLTKLFLYHLSMYFIHVPVRGIFDSDVYGLMIFKDYRYTNFIKTNKGFTSSCSRMIFKGTYLLENQNSLGHLDITQVDFTRMRSQSTTSISSSLHSNVTTPEFSPNLIQFEVGDLLHLTDFELNDSNIVDDESDSGSCVDSDDDAASDVTELCDEVTEIFKQQRQTEKFFICLIGLPASGKSTVVKHLTQFLDDNFKTKLPSENNIKITPLILEVKCSNTSLRRFNIDKKANNSDYLKVPKDTALLDFFKRIEKYESVYEPVTVQEIQTLGAKYFCISNVGETYYYECGHKQGNDCKLYRNPALAAIYEFLATYRTRFALEYLKSVESFYTLGGYRPL
ncbi:hypothetical protein CANARDRAFT_187372, partial [[Candida] arabinofermentans NRRL YB-2248]